nr:hypothetical protein [Nocardia sp. CC227C]
MFCVAEKPPSCVVDRIERPKRIVGEQRHVDVVGVLDRTSAVGCGSEEQHLLVSVLSTGTEQSLQLRPSNLCTLPFHLSDCIGSRNIDTTV